MAKSLDKSMELYTSPQKQYDLFFVYVEKSNKIIFKKLFNLYTPSELTMVKSHCAYIAHML